MINREPPHFGRIVLSAAFFILMLVWHGPYFAAAMRPKPATYLDFSQEWLSARNFWSGRPAYLPQRKALDIHTHDPTQTVFLDWNGHPPFTSLVALPLGLLPYQDAHMVWNILGLGMFATGCGLLIYHMDISLNPQRILCSLALLLCFYPFLSTLQQGQLTFLLFFLLTLASLATQNDRPLLAGVLVGLAAALKLFPGLLAVYFLVRGRCWALFACVGTFLAANGFSALVFGVEAYRTYITEVIPALQHFTSDWYNHSLHGFIAKLFAPSKQSDVIPLFYSPKLSLLLRGVCFLFVLIGLIIPTWKSRSEPDDGRVWGAWMAGMVLLAPVAWDHYFLLLTFSFFVLLIHLQPGPTRIAWLTSLSLMWIPPLWIYCVMRGRESLVELMRGGDPSLIPPLTPGEGLFFVSLPFYALVFFTLVSVKLAFGLVKLTQACSNPPTSRFPAVERRNGFPLFG